MADGEQVEWSVAYYDVLQNTVGGGKPKMKWHFETTAKAWPATVRGEPGPASYDDGGAALIDALQDAKTVIYRSIVEQAAVARPGVLALMDAAIAAPGSRSASARRDARRLREDHRRGRRPGAARRARRRDRGRRRRAQAGPRIDLARARLGGLDSAKCVVIEDSLVGLRAAKGAGGMRDHVHAEHGGRGLLRRGRRRCARRPRRRHARRSLRRGPAARRRSSPG